MTEAEWITTKLPLYLIGKYPGRRDARKSFLASLHCLWHGERLLSELQRQYVGAVERLSEGVGTSEEANRLWNEVEQESHRRHFFSGNHMSSGDMSAYYAHRAVRSFFCAPRDCLLHVFRDVANSVGFVGSEADEKAWQCDLIREVFGNPFRPVDVSAWLTSDVVALANGIYAEKAFDRMPILADALQDAGCDDVNVLDHCREPWEHVRGCWVVDLLLGKG